MIWWLPSGDCVIVVKEFDKRFLKCIYRKSWKQCTLFAITHELEHMMYSYTLLIWMNQKKFNKLSKECHVSDPWHKKAQIFQNWDKHNTGNYQECAFLDLITVAKSQVLELVYEIVFLISGLVLIMLYLRNNFPLQVEIILSTF